MVALSELAIQAEDATSLSQHDLWVMGGIEQNCWADEDGIGEFVHCPNCNSVHSRQDIFGHLTGEIADEVVSKIVELMGIDSVICPVCNHDTEFLYDVDACVTYIKERYRNSRSFLTTVRNDQGEIVGFMDAYISDFKTIYRRELEHYYRLVGEDKLTFLLEGMFSGELPDSFLEFPSLGTDVRHKRFNIIFAMVREFLDSLPRHIATLPGITEIDEGSNVHAIHHCMGARKLELPEKDEEKALLKSDEHHSSIYVYPDYSVCQDKFPEDVRGFLRQYGRQMKELVA